MDFKTKKKSKQDLIDSAMGDLKSSDETKVQGPLMPTTPQDKTKIAGTLLSPDSGVPSTYHNETRLLPEGIESKTEVFKRPSAKVESEQTDLIGMNRKPPEAKIPAYKPQVYKYLEEDKTNYGATNTMDENTVVVGQGARAKVPPTDEKLSFGQARPSTRVLGSVSASESDARVNQAENLRIAQERLLDLEKELERLRAENEQLASANVAAKDQLFEVGQKAVRLEQDLTVNLKQYQSEIGIFRDSASLKEVELVKSRMKIEELQSRLNVDLRKIRVRERELENRLELIRMEKEALLRSKDDAILDLKRKLSDITHEVDGYRQKIKELNERLETNNEQFSRTVRALRLALTNLEANDSSPVVMAPLKKAE